MELDLTKYTKENVKEVPTTAEAMVVDITQMVATEIFGQSAYDPHKIYLRVSFECEKHNIKGHDDFALQDLAELDNRSRLGKYITKYDEIAVGQKIIIMQDKNSFFKVLLE